ncbi:hypothetical protein O3M35_002802 [Rhynocoris fuscipes]|uniref:SURF1-like protein n=1 Tax=Rhynocoris fuscipes TaxID=488301 RepID=A0AAW1CN40_9HEMI
MFAIRGNIVHLIKRNSTGLSQNYAFKNVCNLRMYSTRIEPQVIKPNLRNLKKAEKEGIGPIGWFLLVIPVSTFGLGTWQIKRKKWKEDLIENLNLKTREPAVPLPATDYEVSQLEFRKVRVRGHFDHSGEMYLGPRSLLSDGQSTYQGKLLSTASNNSSGYLVITPFLLSDTNEKILVNRGWIPFANKNPKTRPDGQITEEVELEGVVRLTEPRPAFSPKNKLDSRVWFHRDVEGMAEITDSRPVFIDASAESTVKGGPIGGQTKAFLRNEHFSYIITWYGISLGTAYLWYKKFIKK